MHFRPLSWCRHLFCLSVLVLSFPAVAATAASTIVWEGRGGQQLWLGASETRQRNRHPHTIPIKALARFLGGLYVARKDQGIVREGRRDPLFSEAKASELARLLARALRQAGPHQDVFFQINDTVEKFGGYVGVEVSNAGRVFVDQNGYLNVIFGDIQKGYKERWLYGRKVGRTSRPRTGSRLKAGKLEYRIMPASTVRFFQSQNGKRRQDWIIFDPNYILYAETKTPDGGPRSKGQAGKSSSGLEDRLRRLKRLRASALISEEIYRAEVERLLKNL